MLAAYEAICFQTRDLIEAFAKDTPTWKRIDCLTVGGEYSDNSFLLQMLADLCGIRVERPQTTYPACLGTMIAAGLTMKILHMDRLTSMFTPPMEIFKPTMCLSSKNERPELWALMAYLLCTFLHFDDIYIGHFSHIFSQGNEVSHMEICDQQMFGLAGYAVWSGFQGLCVRR